MFEQISGYKGLAKLTHQINYQTSQVIFIEKVVKV